jgi:hypothetical protein
MWQLILGISYFYKDLQWAATKCPSVARIHKCFRILFLQGFLIHLSYKKKRKEDFRINSTFKLILLAYMGLLKGKKSDPIIFRILNLDLLLLLLFSSLFRGLFILFGFNCKWASYKFT